MSATERAALYAAGLTRKQAYYLAFYRWHLMRRGHGHALATPDLLALRAGIEEVR